MKDDSLGDVMIRCMLCDHLMKPGIPHKCMIYCVMCDKEYSKSEKHDCRYVATTIPECVGIEKALAPNVYEKEIWNKAIKAAADKCIDWENEIEIRKLMK